MKIYKYSDTANDEVGFVIYKPKEQITYITWSSPHAYKFEFGKILDIKIFTPQKDPYKTFTHMEQEILAGRTDYGKFINIEKGGEHLIVEHIFRAG